MGITELPEGLPGAVITFPLLGEGFALNPSGTYQLFGHTFYWYGAIIGLGFLLGVLYCFRRGPKDFGVSTDTLTDVVLIGLPSAMVGARLYYVLCHWDNYVGDTVLSTLWNWCRIWEGGSAIPGGLVLVLLFVWLYARRKKDPLRRHHGHGGVRPADRPGGGPVVQLHEPGVHRHGDGCLLPHGPHHGGRHLLRAPSVPV